MPKHLNVKIYGRVQGVFFRYSAQKKAKELGVAGFAKNKADGTVYIEAEGEERALEEFLDWCKRGPMLAKVEKVEKTKGELKNFSGFNIK